MHNDRPNGEDEKLGYVIVRAEERKFGSRNLYKIMFKPKNFKDKAIFYRLNKLLPSGEFVAIYESETSILDLEEQHSFKEASVRSINLINDNEDQKAMIEVFQW